MQEKMERLLQDAELLGVKVWSRSDTGPHTGIALIDSRISHATTASQGRPIFTRGRASPRVSKPGPRQCSYDRNGGVPPLVEPRRGEV